MDSASILHLSVIPHPLLCYHDCPILNSFVGNSIDNLVVDTGRSAIKEVALEHRFATQV